MILKIQRPIDMDSSPLVLAHNQDYTFQQFIFFIDKLKSIMGNRHKIYVEAEIDKEEGIKVIREVDPQPW